ARSGNPDSGFGASVNAMGLYAHPDYKNAPSPNIKPFPEPRPAAVDLTGQADAIFGDGTTPEPALPPAQRPTAPPGDGEALVFTCVAKAAKERPGKGASFDEVLNRSIQLGLNRTDVEFCLNELLERTRVYEPELGYFKPLEEPTKAELALYTKRGGR